MEQTWVVVAESSRARIFALDGLQTPLREVEDLVNPEGRAHERDLTSDKPGRTIDSTGQKRHSKQANVSYKEQHVDAFARRLAERIELGRTRGDFQRLFLIAAPEFLGLLRGHLGDATRQCIAREVHKNLVRQDEPTIRKALTL